MSKMGDMLIEIEELYRRGHDAFSIANLTGMPIKWIEEFIDQLDGPDDSNYNDSMDGDFDSAMSSAGMGTDEDYGYFGEDSF